MDTYNFIVADVEDGLFCVARPMSYRLALYHPNAIFDWGSQSISSALSAYNRTICPNPSARFPLFWERISDEWQGAVSVAIFSHFHTDHYNGALAAAFSNPSRYDFAPNVVYIPRLPRFAGANDFITAMFALNLRVAFQQYGFYQLDLVRAVRALEEAAGYKSRAAFLAVSQGMRLDVLGMNAHVVWPPEQIAEGGFIGKVEKAIKAYDEGKAKDPVLGQIEDLVSGSMHAKKLTQSSDERQTGIISETSGDYADGWKRLFEKLKGPETIPESTSSLNKAFKNIANELSIVLALDDAILLMGDAGKSATTHQMIVSYLQKDVTSEFNFLQAAHHGTYWSSSLQGLRAEEVLVSAGPRLYTKYNQNWRLCADNVASTYISGDLCRSHDRDR